MRLVLKPLLLVLAASYVTIGFVNAESLAIQRGVRQLFLDDRAIQQMDGLRRVTHQATKSPKNPVLRREHPWEYFRVMLYGTVIYDEQDQIFRMWYMPIPRNSNYDKAIVLNGKNRVPWCTLVGYATSKDGVHWEKPILGQVDFEGSRQNNLINIGQDNIEGISVVRNRHSDDPEKRWLAFFWEHHSYRSKEFNVPTYDDSEPGVWEHGMWIASSPDGVRWTDHGRVIAADSDTHQTVIYDPKLKKYVCFNRIHAGGRRTARLESSDFVNWSPSQRVFEADSKDPPETQVYGLSVIIYEGWYVGIPWLMYPDGKIDMHLAYSRDGIDWLRPEDRTAVIACGEKGSWDGMDLRMGSTIVVKDDTIFIYYCGAIGAHPVKPGEILEYTSEYEQKYRSTHIGLATLRRDGWVSLRAGKKEGTLTTHALRWPDGSLHSNVDVAKGTLRVAVKDEGGKTIATSAPLTGDHTDTVIAFQGKAPQQGQTVTLEFALQNGDLYSFWWEK